jgi:hypothetical protein
MNGLLAAELFVSLGAPEPLIDGSVLTKPPMYERGHISLDNIALRILIVEPYPKRYLRIKKQRL